MPFGAPQLGHTGTVQQDVHRSQLSLGFVESPLALSEIRHVRGDRRGLHSERSEFLGKGLGGVRTETAGCARNQRNLSFQSEKIL